MCVNSNTCIRKNSTNKFVINLWLNDFYCTRNRNIQYFVQSEKNSKQFYCAHKLPTKKCWTTSNGIAYAVPVQLTWTQCHRWFALCFSFSIEFIPPLSTLNNARITNVPPLYMRAQHAHANEDANMGKHLNFRVHFFRLKWFPDVDRLGTYLQAFISSVQKLTGWSFCKRESIRSIFFFVFCWANTFAWIEKRTETETTNKYPKKFLILQKHSARDLIFCDVDRHLFDSFESPNVNFVLNNKNRMWE